ncbi:MAG: hypothetical protein Q9212_005025 [Teloschistes hypoglaucus]
MKPDSWPAKASHCLPWRRLIGQRGRTEESPDEETVVPAQPRILIPETNIPGMSNHDTVALFTSWYGETQDDFRNFGRHYHIAKLLNTSTFQEYWQYLVYLCEETPVQASHPGFSTIEFELQRRHEDNGVLVELTLTYDQAAVKSKPALHRTQMLSTYLLTARECEFGSWRNHLVTRRGDNSQYSNDRMGGLHESVFSTLVGLLLAPATLFWGGKTRLPMETFHQYIKIEDDEPVPCVRRRK